MSWRFTPSRGTRPVHHTDGNIPPRPLEPGDYVIEPNGVVRYVVAVAPSLLQLDDTKGRRRIAHRAPTEGDFSGVIVGIPLEDERP
jgi:hypothetical protein